MRKSSLKVSKLTYVSTGSYTLVLLNDREVLFGRKAFNILCRIFKEGVCSLCSRTVSASSIGLLSIKDNEVFILCRNCLLGSIDIIKCMIERHCC